MLVHEKLGLFMDGIESFAASHCAALEGDLLVCEEQLRA